MKSLKHTVLGLVDSLPLSGIYVVTLNLDVSFLVVQLLKILNVSSNHLIDFASSLRRVLNRNLLIRPMFLTSTVQTVTPPFLLPRCVSWLVVVRYRNSWIHGYCDADYP